MATRREQPVGVRLSPDEMQRLEAQIARSGLTRAAYMRMATLERIEQDEAKGKAERAK